ncbi:MAG: glycosyltransferase [Aphanocapsa sp. GSE-SYN-MK-11-07L]|jgi:dolichol-phosphate mannosyltransferase|nr:glycosyltransferase [Aphanocapsa sp. GSE-SYN-MK-11-07L]
MDINEPNALLPTPLGCLEVLSNISNSSLIRFSLILPTYNEGMNIQKVIAVLTELLDGILPEAYELIVVDDDSPDQTWKLAQALLPDYPQLQVMRRVAEKGLSTAVIRGWQVARGEILGVIDADLQHPPEVLLSLWQQMQRGADLAVASRNADGGGVSEWSLIRRFLSRGAQMLGLLILPEVISRLSDPMSGYFMIRRSAIANRRLSPVGYKILIEAVARGRFPWISEVGYVFQERRAGESKVTWKQYVEYIQHLLRLRLFLSARFIQFCLVGFSGVFVDMGFLYLLSDPTTLHLPLTRSKIIAAELAIINNFLWNDFWTFGDISRRQPGKRQRLKRLIKFNLICLAGLTINVVILNLLFNVLGLNRYLANLIAIALVTVWNFWFNLKLSWRVTDVGN